MPHDIRIIQVPKELRVVLDRTAPINIAGGDMAKSIYDIDNDHVVDNAMNAIKLNNIAASSYLKDTDHIDCGTF